MCDFSFCLSDVNWLDEGIWFASLITVDVQSSLGHIVYAVVQDKSIFDINYN